MESNNINVGYTENSLRNALFNICNYNPQYEPLRASFIMAQQETAERLNLAAVNFTEYTRHDAKHAENVVTKMDMLIGNSRIPSLGPTDIWLLLMCAHTHDWGMFVSLADLREHLTGLEQHMENLRDEHMGIYSRAAHELDLERLQEQINAPLQHDINLLNALNTQRSLMLVLQSYFRRHHAEGYGKVLEQCSYTGVDRRLRELVATINKTHVGDWKEVMKLPHQTDGYSRDYAHPRFVSVMLRLADLMDIDSGRVNPFQVQLISNSSEAQAHQEKHLSVRRVLTSAERVGAHFQFDTKNIYNNYNTYGEHALTPLEDNVRNEYVTRIRTQAAKEAFAWYDMLKEELKNLSLHWHSVVPAGYEGNAPTAEDNEFSVSFDGKDVTARDLDLRYVLSYVRAFELISGTGLYRDRLTFIRELVQNAMDAQKLQLFRDWENRNEPIRQDGNNSCSDISIEKFFSSLPYDLDEVAIRVEVHISSDTTEKVDLIIKDFGTGISHEKLRKLRYVGDIQDTETEKLKRRMPQWLRPTGSFGIGLQSVFDFLKSSDQIENSFTLNTRSSQTDKAMKITFRANRSEGEIFYEDCNGTTGRPRNGTDAIVPLTANLDDILTYFGVTGVDIFASKGERVAKCLKEYLERTISHDIVPVRFEIIKKPIDRKPMLEPPLKIEQQKLDYISANIFNKAFDLNNLKYVIPTTNYGDFDKKAEIDWAYADYKYFKLDIKTDNLSFWQWNSRNHILVNVQIGGLLIKISDFNNKLTQCLSGKAQFSFRGIKVDVGNPITMPMYEWTMRDMPWCDLDVYIMGGRAKNVLAISRDSFLNEDAIGSDIGTIITHTKDTLAMAFSHFICLIADINTINHLNDNKIIEALDKYLDKNPAACILLSIVAHCLSLKAYNRTKNKAHVHDPIIALDQYTVKSAINRFINKLNAIENAHKVEMVHYNKKYRQVIATEDKLPVVIWLEQLANMWFLHEDDATVFQRWNIENTGELTADCIKISRDPFKLTPFPLYWSEIFFHESNGFITPIYKYRSTPSRGLRISDNDKRTLFNLSYAYGCLQTKKESIYEGSENKIMYDYWINIFGDRHAFPTIKGYELLSIPYNKKICPPFLASSGNVLLSPFTVDVFKDDMFNEIKKVLDKVNLKTLEETLEGENKAIIRKIVWTLFYPDDKKSDKYGMLSLIKYVRKHSDPNKPISEYKQKYVDFILEYYNTTFAKHP